MCSDRRAARGPLVLLLAAVLWTPSLPAEARVLLSIDEALRLAFPGAEIQREAVFLTDAERTRAAAACGEPVERALVVRHVARRDGAPAGTAYVDVHRVRTLEETLFVVVAPEARIARVEVLSFDEPPDYLPRGGWYGQFAGRGLDDELKLDRGIRAVSGATLTATATTAAARRVLALHAVIEARAAEP